MYIQAENKLQALLQQYSTVFNDETGRFQGVEAKIVVDPAVPPKFCRARTVPHALKPKVEIELKRLQQTGIIKPIEHSDWAAPIVPVVKKDGSVRICGDYHLTVNRAAKPDTYPLPRIDDIFASLSGGKTFSKLDLANAYQQIPLEQKSKQLVTINTHKGLYCYNRFPFGISAAPSIFQHTMENVLQGIPNTCIYLDDLLVTGDTQESHLANLEAVLSKLQTAGLRLKRSKCTFMMPSVEYLGHQISTKGIQPTEDKVRAIKDAPVPTDVTQLQSFVGRVNYYGKFLPNLSSALAPLYILLQKSSKWKWGAQQDKAFSAVKSQLTSECLLTHFDPQKPLTLACYASPYGVGAVLSHRLDDGSERPIAFASRSLSPAEKGYAQLDKEALAIVFGVTKFHVYLYGHSFTIYSDHKPLQYLFNPSKAISAMASARVQRWALLLSSYQYTVSYKPGSQMANADVLSRLPLPEMPESVPALGETVLLMQSLQAPITFNQLKQWTTQDPILSKVHTLLLQGWQYSNDPNLKPYQVRHNELTVCDGCVMWGSRVVVPQAGRKSVMEQLHDGHPGTSRMKSLARNFVWWPQMDDDIADRVKSCNQCQLTRHAPQPAPLHPWEWPDRPWTRLHIDYAGPYLEKWFLIVVDAHSKWLEVKIVKSATTANTTDHLRSLFATHGLPEMIVSDNGSVFTNVEFQDFCSKNGIKHVKSAPYHPASNGLAERAVQTFKEAMKRADPRESLSTRVSRFLFKYRMTPHSTTGISPAELLLERRPRSHFDFMLPNLASKIRSKQLAQKVQHDKKSKPRTLKIGSNVLVRNFSTGPEWLFGTIVNTKGPLSYIVKLSDGRYFKRHIDHLRKTDITDHYATVPDVIDDFIPFQSPTTTTTAQQANSELPTPLRRSTRVRTAPDRLTYPPK